MTEAVLERANELNKAIRKEREKLETLYETQKKCWGNTSEVRNRVFEVTAAENRGKYSAEVSPESAQLALNAEIAQVTKKIEQMKAEFEKLH